MEDLSRKGTEDLGRVDRGDGRRATSRPQVERLGWANRWGQHGLGEVRPGLFQTEPDPEAPDAHLELQRHGNTCPHDLREGLRARGAHDRRGAAVVPCGLPQLSDQWPGGHLPQDGERDGAGAARAAHPDQAMTPLGGFQGPSTPRTGQRFHPSHLPRSLLRRDSKGDNLDTTMA
jgi:hypothetical protein